VSPAAVGVIAPLITADGAALSSMVLDSLIDLRISLGLRLPGRARLTFLDEGFVVSASSTFKLGTKIVITVGDGEALFTGEITGVELDVERGAPNVTVIADDASYKMTLGNKARTFTKSSYGDVVQKIAKELGMQFEMTRPATKHEYLLQADTNFGFLCEICDRAGYDWWVDPKGKLQFHPMGASRGTGPTLAWGTRRTGMRHFSVRASALHPKDVTVYGWDAGTAKEVTARSNQVKGTPNADLVTPYVEAKALSGFNAVQSAHRMFSQLPEGTELATSAATLALMSAVTAEGVVDVNADIVVGGSVTVSDVGPASGTYSVTQVEHSYTAQGFLTRFVAGDRAPTGLVDSLSAPVTSSFRQDALVIGVVTNTGNSDGSPGTVKVKYPALGGTVESAWARVVSMGAGKTRGMTFIPEVNDEVIVGFESGDVTRPIVLGGVYSTANSALDFGVADGTVAKRQIVSRLGHVIELGDGRSPAEQRIALTLAGGDFSVDLSKEGLAAKVPTGKPISISAGDSTFEIDKSGNITISGQKITIKATQDVEISGMNVKTKASLGVEASGIEAKVTGSAKAEVSSGGQTSVKGTLVMIN
jgi:phage protein D/phage baseplate assembly protein gpV